MKSSSWSIKFLLMHKSHGKTNFIWKINLSRRAFPNGNTASSLHYRCCDEKDEWTYLLGYINFVFLSADLAANQSCVKPTYVEIRLNAHPTQHPNPTSEVCWYRWYITINVTGRIYYHFLFLVEYSLLRLSFLSGGLETIVPHVCYVFLEKNIT